MAKCNEEQCTCPSIDCERHGKCCVCINHHREKKSLTHCMKPFANEEKEKRADGLDTVNKNITC